MLIPSIPAIPTHRPHRGAAIGLAAAAVGVVALAAAGLADGWTRPLVMALSAALIAWRARGAGADRPAWIALAIAPLAWAAGELGHAERPGDEGASIVDVACLAFYPSVYAGLLLTLRRRVRGLPASIWLEGLVGALALSALAAAGVFDEAVRDVAGDLGATLDVVAFPVGDLVLLATAALGFPLMGWRPGRAWAVLTVALTVLLAGDVAHLVQVTTGDHVPSGLVVGAAPLGATLLALAAWQPVPARAYSEHDRNDSLTYATTVFFAVVVVALLLSDMVHNVNDVAQGLVSAAVVVLLVRVGLAGRERRVLEDTRREARTDELTGLPNRSGFYATCQHTLQRGVECSLLLLDLNRFKELNDTLGHTAGEDLLRLVAQRLRKHLGPDREALDAPFVLETMSAPVSASIGIALAPEHATTRPELLRCADVAMYAAKARNTGSELYSPGDDRHSRERLQLVTDLHGALHDPEQLMLHYQPKVDASTGRLEGVEALARWHHPQRGTIPPSEFIPLAETHGLMRELTLAVLDRALAQEREWRADGRAIHVAVNLSAANLLDLNLVGDVASMTGRYGTPHDALQLEITEDTLMVDPPRALDVLAQLSELGIRFSLDDFGTGYSSLSQLKRLPVHELKIDRCFVADMCARHEDAVIVQSTIDLAHSLGLRVVAEGVERTDQQKRLARMGCDLLQGYLVCPPVDAAGLRWWLGARDALARSNRTIG